MSKIIEAHANKKRTDDINTWDKAKSTTNALNETKELYHGKS